MGPVFAGAAPTLSPPLVTEKGFPPSGVRRRSPCGLVLGALAAAVGERETGGDGRCRPGAERRVTGPIGTPSDSGWRSGAGAEPASRPGLVTSGPTDATRLPGCEARLHLVHAG